MSGIRVCIISMIFTFIYLITSIMLTNLIFPNKSNGSLIKIKNKIIGSKLIGQEFTSNVYFHGRPSLHHYKNNISGNSSFPYFSTELIKNTQDNYSLFTKENPNSIPDLNLITESASGLDPHITYTSALNQTERITKFSHLDKEQVIKIVQKCSKPRIFSLFGDKIVNVLDLNLKLKDLYAKTSRS